MTEHRMGMNSAKKARIKHAKKNTPKGRAIARHTKAIRNKRNDVKRVKAYKKTV